MIVEVRNVNLPCDRHELEEVFKFWFKARSLFTKAYKYIDAVIFDDLSESKYRVEMNGYENRYIIYLDNKLLPATEVHSVAKKAMKKLGRYVDEVEYYVVALHKANSDFTPTFIEKELNE